jgi:CBS domain-containing protein
MADRPIVDFVGKLPISVRRVYSGEGELTSAVEVYCHPRERSVPVETCEGCDDYAGMLLAVDGSRKLVLCRRLNPETARGLERPTPPMPRRLPVLEPTPADRVPVSEILTADVVCVREDLTLAALAKLLLDRGLSGVPVVDAAGRPIGVVSKTDLVRHPDATGRVAEVMTPMSFVLHPDATISQAAALMAFEGVHRLPVVSDDGKVIGLCSSLDVLRWLGQRDGYLVAT